MKTRLLSILVVALVWTAAVGRASDSPVIEVPPGGGAPGGGPLLVMLTGDGGWAEFVRVISEQLTADGWAAVGFDTRKFLWTRRNPEETAAAVDEVIRAYTAKWHRENVVVAGFSRGADIAPFVVNRLPEPTRAKVRLVVLLSPGAEAEFEFHLLDLMRDARATGRWPVMPELQRLSTPALLLHGLNDPEALTPPPATPTREVLALPGDHHLDKDYPRIVAAIRTAYVRVTANAPAAPAAR